MSKPSETDSQPELTLRSARRSDLRELVRLESELFGAGAWPYDVLDSELHAPGRHYLVALAPTVGPIGVDAVAKIVGYGGIAVGDIAEVMTVGVTAAAQGRGIGRALVEALVDIAESAGVNQTFLEVRVDNAAAISLYRSLGFTDVRIRRGYYQPENIDALVMRRERGVI